MAVFLEDDTPDLPTPASFYPFPFPLPSQAPHQIVHMRPRGDHPIAIPMQDQNPVFPHLSPNAAQLLVAFGMQARGDGLQDEAGAGEADCGGKEEAFVQLEGGEAVAVGGEDGGGVGGGEPGGGEETGFYGGELGVDGTGDAAVGGGVGKRCVGWGVFGKRGGEERGGEVTRG